MGESLSLPEDFSKNEIQERVTALGPWFHNLSLDGVQTAPDHFLGDYPAIKWKGFQHAIPADLTGLTVLDIGCTGGFYSIEMKRRGAARVLGIDHDQDYLAQARYAARILKTDIEFQQLSVYEVGQLREQFDLVLYMGVFYHLRHPLLALDLLRRHVAKDWFVFQSMLRGSRTKPRIEDDYPFAETTMFDHPGFPKMHFIEKNYSGDCTNWWVPNRACAEAVLRSAGFNIVDSPEVEVMICRCNPDAELHPLPEGLA